MAGFEGKCPSCNSALKITDPSFSGRKIRCPKCSNTFRLPEFDAPDPDVLEEESAPIVRDEAEERKPTKPRQRPEGDEDFVDEPKSRPKRKDAASDAADSKSSTRRQMDDDGDSRPSKRREETEVDDRPRKRRDEARDDDKRPRKRKEEEYDRPRKRRDEEEDDDRPARRSSSRARGDQNERKGKTGSSTRMVVFICIGVFVTVGMGLLIYAIASGPSIRGEKEVRELIAISRNAKEEKDKKKQMDAVTEQFKLMDRIERMQLTLEEQQKIKERYGDEIKEFNIPLDTTWNYYNNRKEQAKPPAEKKNDIDSLLAELNNSMTSDPNAADALIKRITTNIPTDSPRRAEVFKAVLATLKREKSLTDNQWLELTLRFASTQDISELTALMKERWRWGGARGEIMQKLIELKAPNVQSLLIEDLKSSNINDRTHAAAELRKMGSSVEKDVQSVAGPENSNYDGRINAIKLLGDIGSEDSATFLLSLKEKDPLLRDKINDAEKRIRARMKNKNDGSSTP